MSPGTRFTRDRLGCPPRLSREPLLIDNKNGRFSGEEMLVTVKYQVIIHPRDSGRPLPS